MHAPTCHVGTTYRGGRTAWGGSYGNRGCPRGWEKVEAGKPVPVLRLFWAGLESWADQLAFKFHVLADEWRKHACQQVVTAKIKLGQSVLQSRFGITPSRGCHQMQSMPPQTPNDATASQQHEILTASQYWLQAKYTGMTCNIATLSTKRLPTAISSLHTDTRRWEFAAKQWHPQLSPSLRFPPSISPAISSLQVAGEGGLLICSLPHLPLHRESSPLSGLLYTEEEATGVSVHEMVL